MVDDLQVGGVGVFVAPPHLDRLAVAVFDRVRQQIGHHLLEAQRVQRGRHQTRRLDVDRGLTG